MIGMSSATWSETGRASVLIRMISAWTSGGWPTSAAAEVGVGHDLRVVLERVGDDLLLGRGEDRALFRQVGEAEGERGQHDRAGERQAERQPERTRRPSSRRRPR